jgi:hypothetical protein
MNKNRFLTVFLFSILLTVSVGCNSQIEVSVAETSQEGGKTNTPLVCPTGFVLVPSNSIVGAENDFCVMKYEAKSDGFGGVESKAESTPVTSVTIAQAKTHCQNLNAANSVVDKYDLISNPEWMAIARNIENVARNWTGDSVGVGCVRQGNIGSVPTCDVGISSYDHGGTPDFGSTRLNENLASLYLDNENIIMDFGGNVSEWVDWTLDPTLNADLLQGSRPYVTADGSTVTSWREFKNIDVFPGSEVTIDMITPFSATFDSTDGLGTYLSYTSGTHALRGGHFWNDNLNGGIYTLSFQPTAALSFGTIGFRCVFRE